MPSWDSDAGLAPLSPPPQNLDSMQPKAAVDAIIRWFHDNFEDPAQSTSYDSREGGYIYVWGPYDAREILEETFQGLAPEDLIRFAVDQIEGDGTEWVPAGGRILPPDDDEPPPMSTAEAHAQMRQEIQRLQARVAEVESALAGIGHNRPPEPLEEQPLTRAELGELKGALTTLDTQPVEPADNGAAATTANQTLTSTRDKIRGWLAQAREAAARAAINTVVGEGLKALGVRLWPLIEQGLTKIIEIASRWLYMLL